jgi:DNA (cytosine-5)-methyltransferase 1
MPRTDQGQRRWRVLDLFCGAGGASAGYHTAGFDVEGVDIAPQPDYPYPFTRADALTAAVSGFDIVHASPPCQRYSAATPAGRRTEHPDLVPAVRAKLAAAIAAPGGPWAYVIENVPGAPMHHPVVVCGDSLRLGVRRHRLFESNLSLAGTGCHHDRTAPPVPVYGSYGQRGRARRNTVDGQTSPPTDAARAAMGIDWMPWPALTQAIPPAYTFWLGTQIAAYATDRISPVPDAGCDATAAAIASPGLGDEYRRREASPATGDATAPAGIRHGCCRHCARPLPARPAAGRWPRYCSHACRQAAYRTRKATTARSRHDHSA